MFEIGIWLITILYEFPLHSDLSMATFVVTGYNRTRSKCYRPSYTSDLAPIYEDRIQQNPEVIHKEYVSTVFQPDFFQRDGPYAGSPSNARDNNTSTDSYMMKPVRQYRKNPYSSQTCGSMLNGIMTNRFQTKRNVASNRTDNHNRTKDIDKQTSINNNNNDTEDNSNQGEGLTRKTSLYQVDSVSNILLFFKRNTFFQEFGMKDYFKT